MVPSSRFSLSLWPCICTVYMYMYVCVYTYIHACMHTYMHTYIHTYIHACIHTYIHACMHTYMHTYIHPYMHTCMHTYIHTYIQTHTDRQTDIQTDIHTYRQTYIPYHTMPCHAMPCHAMPCHTLPYHTIPYIHTHRYIYIYDICSMQQYAYVPHHHHLGWWSQATNVLSFFLTKWMGCNRQGLLTWRFFTLGAAGDCFQSFMMPQGNKIYKHPGNDEIMKFPPTITFSGSCHAEVVSPAPPEPSYPGRPLVVRRARRGATAPWSAASNCRGWEAVLGAAPVLRGWVASPWPEEAPGAARKHVG